MEHVADVRVIFADTDAMGIVYYANYLKWFEMGRVELLRKKAMVYRDLTSRGYHLPVVEAGVRYHTPARYDDSLRIHAEVRKLGGASIEFGYVIDRADGKRIAEGETLHAFTDDSGKVVRMPADFLELVRIDIITGVKGG
ncbi:MAG: acyl-CoA thioesterase [Deltaproteobacteria bacterium]|nr:acyl-CoA thioesterase [Deltaproteobacteria bacterium]